MTREEAIARIELSATGMVGTLAATTEPAVAEILQRYIDAYDMAISALREQENRIESDTVEGCDWCANTEPGAIHTTVKRGNITFHDRAKLCPMCGRRLEEEV